MQSLVVVGLLLICAASPEALSQVLTVPAGATFGVNNLNNVYNASLASGPDIGAKVNSVVGLCAGACSVFIPAGTYSFSTPIVLASNVNLYGAGKGVTSLFYSGTAGSYAISAGPSTSQVQIHDLTLTAAVEIPSNLSSYNGLFAISVTGSHSLLNNIYVAHFWGSGNMVLLGGSFNTIRDSDLEYGTFVLGTAGAGNIVENNYISNHYSQAQAYENPMVHYWDGINGEGAKNTLYKGNTVFDNGQSGIYNGGNGTAAFGNKIIGNHVQYNWNRGIDQGVTGDVVAGSTSVQSEIIANNQVIDNLQSNIWLACVQYATVVGNYSEYTPNYTSWFGSRTVASTASGIVLYEGCGAGTAADVDSYITVTGNTVVDLLGTTFANINYNISRGVGNSITGNSINRGNYIPSGLNYAANYYQQGGSVQNTTGIADASSYGLTSNYPSSGLGGQIQILNGSSGSSFLQGGSSLSSIVATWPNNSAVLECGAAGSGTGADCIYDAWGSGSYHAWEINRGTPAMTLKTTGLNVTVPISYNNIDLPTVGSPTINRAACIKAAGPPVVIGYCSTVVSASGSCTCN